MKKILFSIPLVGFLVILPFVVSATAPRFTVPDYQTKIADVNENSIGKLVVDLTDFGTKVAGVVAIVMILWAGLQRITAGGDSSKVEESSEIMWGAIVGLGIALASVLLLNAINPDLTKTVPIKFPEVKTVIEAKKPEVELTESEGEGDPQTQARIGQAERSGTGGNNSANAGQLQRLPNGIDGMPQANGNFLGYGAGVRGGTPALRDRLTQLNTSLNDSAQNPDGTRGRVSSMNDHRHGTNSSHYDDRSLDYALRNPDGSRLNWNNATDRAHIQNVITMAQRSGFNVYNEYDPANWTSNTSGGHLHLYVNRQ